MNVDIDADRHESLVTVTLEDIDGETKVGFHRTVFTAIVERNPRRSGWNASIDRLEASAGREGNERV